jgi:Tfp pilus assembly protein FimV
VKAHEQQLEHRLRALESELQNRQKQLAQLDQEIAARKTAAHAPGVAMAASIESFWRNLPRSELQRAVVLSEVFRKPLALRDDEPASWDA